LSNKRGDIKKRQSRAKHKSAGGIAILSGLVPSERHVKSRWCCCCRRGVVCQWRCWRQCWWERFWCSMSLTLRLMMTAVHASREVLRGELSLCWRQCAGTGVTHCVAGLAHQLVSGSGISWPSSFNV